MRIALRHFLYKINAAESDKCPCGEGSQTPKHVLLQCGTFSQLRRELFGRLLRTLGPNDLVDYDSLVSNPLATRYVAKFMHQTGLLAQFQHVEQEEDDIEPDDPTVTEHGPEDAGYQPLNTTFEEGESLNQLFEYTLPDWLANNNVEHLIEEEARLANAV
jgi:hypothetical protein